MLKDEVEKLKVLAKASKREVIVDILDDIDRGNLSSSPGWGKVIGERKVVTAAACDAGFAEETILFLAFEDGTFEVGMGESLRPYNQVYKGSDEEVAVEKFSSIVTKHLRIIG